MYMIQALVSVCNSLTVVLWETRIGVIRMRNVRANARGVIIGSTKRPTDLLTKYLHL
ncbi:uncharacterized protein DEA37_0003863 [Paragonimus westermani]|uniref:Uncharacterized protein n=1 Tax=Paragonimus westermani TaxID=34504 RepID=A0A5J4N887_9TREM|nr:uncharacterized protein DEA37_0003863 [Paragonimus westermani]